MIIILLLLVSSSSSVALLSVDSLIPSFFFATKLRPEIEKRNLRGNSSKFQKEQTYIEAGKIMYNRMSFVIRSMKWWPW